MKTEMKKHELNFEKSKEVYGYFKDNIKVKECYTNIFNIVTLSPKTFRKGKWKVAYGYAEVMAGVYCRHCFILDENGKVIDPTLFTHSTSSKPTHTKYYIMATFNNIDDYLEAIENDNYMPALDKYFKEQEKQALQWAKENDIFFVG